jgi:hypothetical protein
MESGMSFTFPHRLNKLLNYGEYIISIFAVTNPTFHNTVSEFDKAVRRQVRSVQNSELLDHDRFVNLKIAHIDSIRIAINIRSSCTDSNHSKHQRNKLGKKDEPWNDDKCSQTKEECQRQNICNMCGKAGHKGKECKQCTK